MLLTNKHLYKFILALVLFPLLSFSQNSNLDLSIRIDDNTQTSFKENGRLFVFLSENPQVEPRTQIWPNPTSRTTIIAKNVEHWKKDETLTVNRMSDWVSTASWNLDNIPDGTYYIQVLWDQDTEESRISAPGNIFSPKQKVDIHFLRLKLMKLTWVVKL